MTSFKKKKRVVVAMSGGVDSSVAAGLLAKDGYEVIGVTMRLFAAKNESFAKLNKSCCSIEDVEDARKVCRQIKAKHYFLNFEKEFEKHVINYFVSEYEKGRTPHPCLACNDRLKFDFLLKRSELMDADYLATGHYAQIKRSKKGNKLLKAKDITKDQSYVLFNLNQEKMERLLLPVGKYSKYEIREIAKNLSLSIADKPDSQDICFIPSGDYKKFVEPKITKNISGPIINNGKIIGKHKGIHSFTIGQRKGLPIENISNRPVYVTKINPETNEVTVGHAEDLMKKRLFCNKVNWTSGKSPNKPVKASVRIRYNGADSPAEVIPYGKNEAIINFDNPVRAITPGQAVVFYKESEVIGGGIIEYSLETNSSNADSIKEPILTIT
tara:strand:- start:4340 stop:5488 length:1149 start_codon:yes stop_codon:yes gene_type:complete